jgi:hypothetical protein
MSTSEERLKILNMIAEGKITAEEGAKLLNALSRSKSKQRTKDTQGMEGAEPRFLRVRVTDTRSGKVIVNVNLPISLVDVGMRMGARFVPDIEEIDFEDLREGIKHGMRGKIVDVQDDDTGEHVEVFLE